MASSQTIKNMNFNKVFEVLKEKKPVSKTDIAAKVGLSFPTVSRIIDDLIDKRKIIEDGIKESYGGRCSKKYSLNPMYAIVLLVYLEGDILNWIVKDFCENTLKSGRVISKNNIINEIDNIIFLVQSEFIKLASLVIGIASNVDDGKILSFMEYNELKEIDIIKYFNDKYNVPVRLENDMNVAICGYCHRYEMKDNKIIINIYLGHNGVGAGMMINGELWKGASNFAGELHYLPICDDNIIYSRIGFNEVDIVQYYGKIVQSYIALINPDLIVLYNNLYIESKFEDIVTYCKVRIPNEMMPKLLLSNEFINDYEYGLCRIGLDLINGENS